MQVEESTNQRSINRSGHIVVPDGMTVEKVVRQGIAMEANGEARSPEEFVLDLGIGIQTYRRVSCIIILSEYAALSDQDRAIVKDALDAVNTTHRISEPWAQVAPIVTKVFGAADYAIPRIGRIEKRVERFERSFGIIMHSCSAEEELEIPYLSPKRTRKALAEIREARKHLQALAERIEGAHP